MRTIAPEIFTDQFIGIQSLRLRILWFGLIISIADDQGRMVDNPTLIRSLLFPYDADVSTKDIEKDLSTLAKAHKVIRYHAGTNGDGRELIQIVRWWRYQARAQWAKRSTYPAPLKWVDRIRCHVIGGTIETLNWDLSGGFMLKLPKRLPSQLPTPQPSVLARREDEDEDKGRGQGRRKDQPTPLPPSTKRAGKTAGRLAGSDAKDFDPFSELKPQQRKQAQAMQKVLLVSGLGKKQTINLLVQVATRSSLRNNGTDYVLAALASAYADNNAENKPAIAAYRMEHDNVDLEFLKPDKWNVLPKNILKAAGIDDIRLYASKQKMKSFMDN